MAQPVRVEHGGRWSRSLAFLDKRAAVRKRIVPAICLLAFSALIAVLRYHSYSAPLETNVAVHYYMGRELLNGRRIYTDCFDHQPPAVPCTWAVTEYLTGGSPERAVYFAVVVTAVATLLGVYSAASCGGRIGCGLWAGLCWAVISSDCGLYLFLGETELFINAVLTAAFALLVRSQKRLGTTRRSLIGLLFALATLYKHNAVFAIAGLACFHVLFPPEQNGRRAALKDVALWVAIGASVWLCVMAYFVLVGRFADFWDAVFRFNFFYAHNRWNAGASDLILSKIRGLIPPSRQMGFLGPLFLLTLFGLCFRAGSQRRSRMLLLGFGLGLTGVMLWTEYLVYHYEIFVPLLTIGAAWGIEAAGQLAGRFRHLLSVLLGVGITGSARLP